MLLMWTDFKQPLLAELQACSTPQQFRARLAKAGLPGGDASCSSSSGSSSSSSSPGALERERAGIELDLLAHTYQQARTLDLAPLQASTLLSLVWRTHRASVAQRLTIERSFQLLRDSLLAHSLHRPPFSAGVFPPQQAPQLLAWALSSYYRHYKLYQYAFTPRVTLELSSHAAGAEVEAPAQPAALQQALGPEEYQELLAEQERQAEELRRQEAEAEEARAAAEAAAAAQAEEERQAAAVAAEYEAAVPEEVAGHVGLVLQRELDWLRRSMQAQFEEQQAALLAKISALEGRLAAATK